MDVVYIVRRGESNEELRYSLRSLCNFPHDRVWIVGDKPSWVTNVEFVQGNMLGEKWLNSNHNVKLVAKNEEISTEFVLMNDDFFFMLPIDEWYMRESATWWRMPLSEHIRLARRQKNKTWLASLINAHTVLSGCGLANLKAYTLHVPFLMNRLALNDCLTAFDLWGETVISLRTIYGNYTGIGRDTVQDFKYYRTTEHGWDGRAFASTDDYSFRKTTIGQDIRKRFPDPSPYELT